MNDIRPLELEVLAITLVVAICAAIIWW